MAAVTLLLVAFPSSSTSSSYWDFNCMGANFTPGYAKNLGAVAALLPQRTASSPLLFNSSSEHEEEGCSSSTVYAVAECQRDSERYACKTCVTEGLENARQLCGLSVGAMVFLDVCTVAYYNSPMRMLPFDPSINVIMTRIDTTDVTIHGKPFEDSVHQLAEAIMNTTITTYVYFVTGVKAVNTVDYELKIYAAAQCLPSLLPEECQLCLQELMLALKNSADDLTAGRAATIWCTFRFGIRPFFSSSPTLILPTDQPFGGDANPNHGSKHKSKNKVVWIAVGAVVALLLGGAAVVIALVLYCCRKKRLGNQNQPTGELSQPNQPTATGEKVKPTIQLGQEAAHPTPTD